MAIEFVMPRPMSKRWKRKLMPRYHHQTKPDLDNLAKSTIDALSSIWRDDAQIAVLNLSAYVAAGDEHPHCVVEISDLEG